MEKYSRYYGVFTLVTILIAAIFISYSILNPTITKLSRANVNIEKTKSTLEKKRNDKAVVEKKMKKLRDALLGLQKKIYAPVFQSAGNTDNDTLFFNLYNDVIEMTHDNSIKIKKLDYVYNPDYDAFVKYGKDVYFVCEINLELVSNYVNLGKFI